MKCLLYLLLAYFFIAPALARAQTIYEREDKFKGTKTYFTLDRFAKTTVGDLLLSVNTRFSLIASADSHNSDRPFILAVETSTPNWIFISSGTSLILMLNGSETIKLNGPGSSTSRTLVSPHEVQEDAYYPLTLDEITRIGRAKKVEFSVYGDKQNITGELPSSFIRDAAAFAERGPGLLGLTSVAANVGAASSSAPPQGGPPSAQSQIHFGVTSIPVPGAMVGSLKLPNANGVWIVTVEPRSVAEAAGLQEGDVLLKYNGMAVHTPADLVDLVHKTEMGQTVTILLWENYAEKTVTARFDSNATYDEIASRRVHAFGAHGIAVSQNAATGLNLPDTNGVLIAAVSPNSIAQAAGIKQADVILKLKDIRIHGIPDLNDLISKLEPGQTIPIVVWRQNTEVTLEAHF